VREEQLTPSDILCSETSNIVIHHHHHQHHISFMELGHLLTASGLRYPEVSSKVNHDSFGQLGSSVSLPWVIYFEAFYIHVVSSFSCIPVICPNLVLFLTTLQFVLLFCNVSKCTLLFSLFRLRCCYSSDVTCFNDPSFAAITASLGMEEMPSLNMPV